MPHVLSRVLGVIPARLQASRLPGKPLKKIRGKTLLQRVWEQAKTSQSITNLVIATDSEEVLAHAQSFGAQAVMTSDSIQTGSERVAVTSQILGEEMFCAANCAGNHTASPEESWDLIVNIQGDMPFMTGEIIDGAIELLADAPDHYSMSTVAIPIFSKESFLNPSVVKVVFDDAYEALYFSRSPIPYRQDTELASGQLYGYQHLGLYVFLPEAIRFLMVTPPNFLEKTECLEQLRLLAGGYQIGVHVPVDYPESVSVEVNTPEDLIVAEQIATKFD